MKRLWDVLVLTLAVNFLVLAGGVGYLYKAGRLDRERVAKVKEVLFPPTTAPSEGAATQPSDPTTQPTLVLETLLAHRASMTAGQQVDFVRQTFDERQAQLGRREEELRNQQRLLDLAQAKAGEDREAFELERKRFRDEQDQARKLATDTGFQTTLAQYAALPAKQVKGIFATLSDDTVRLYLQAMEARAAAKIVKEYKTPEELDRVQKIMEKIRKAEPATRPINQ